MLTECKIFGVANKKLNSLSGIQLSRVFLISFIFVKICTTKVYKEPLFIMFISKEFLIKKRGKAGHHY